MAGALPDHGDVPITPAAVKAYDLPVHFSVDDADPRSKSAWEGELRKRMLGVSGVLERECGVALAPEAEGEWKSDPDDADLEARLNGPAVVRETGIATRKRATPGQSRRVNC